MRVVLNTLQAAEPGYAGSWPVGADLPVQARQDGAAFVRIENLPPSEVLVPVNHP
jgi:hypothetical protein